MNGLVSGLVLTLDESPCAAAESLRFLRSRPGIEPGEPSGRWLPVAVEAADENAARDLHRWIESLPGVLYADVVFVGFHDARADSPPAGSPPCFQPLSAP